MFFLVVCSAPGKILWLGGYSVLERPNVCFVTGVDKRVYATVVESHKIELKAPQFGFDASGIFEGGKLVLNNDSAAGKFVKTTVEACLKYFAWKGITVKPFTLETRSDDAFGVGGTEAKAGLGGSAAVVVATTAALFEFHGLGVLENKDKIHKIAQYSHSMAQGKVGSGFDVAASCYGASSYVRYSPEILDGPFPQVVEMDWDYATASIPLPPQFSFAIASLGKSASTGEMVEKLNVWKEANTEDYFELMKEYNAANYLAIGELKRLSKDFSEKNLGAFRKMFNHAQLLRKQLGLHCGAEVESEEYAVLREESVANGAFIACLPGAGGGDSIAALCLSPEDKKRLEEFWASRGLKVLGLNISSEGVKLETFKP